MLLHTPMKCPICGHHLARLADPCLNCARVLTGHASARADLRPALASLTLPAELRVPEIPVSATPAPVPAPPTRCAPAKEQAKAEVSSATRPVHDATTPFTTGSEPTSSAIAVPLEPGRTASGSKIRVLAVMGCLLLGTVVYVGAQRPRNPAQTAPFLLRAADASYAGSGVLIAAPSAAASTVRVREGKRTGPAPVSAGPSAAQATARLNQKTLIAKTPEVESSVPLPAPPAIVAQSPSMPRSASEPVAQAGSRLVAVGLHEACGRQGFIARALCINERCTQAAYAGDAECVKLRKATEDAELAVQRGG